MPWPSRFLLGRLMLLVLLHMAVQHVNCLVVFVTAHAYVLFLITVVAHVLIWQFEVLHTSLLGLDFVELKKVIHKCYYLL